MNLRNQFNRYVWFVTRTNVNMDYQLSIIHTMYMMNFELTYSFHPLSAVCN